MEKKKAERIPNLPASYDLVQETDLLEFLNDFGYHLTLQEDQP
jgi:hypothetical protein